MIGLHHDQLDMMIKDKPSGREVVSKAQVSVVISGNVSSPQQMQDIPSHLLISLSDWLIGPLLLYCKHSRATAPPVAMGTRTYLPQQCCCLLSRCLLLIPFLSSRELYCSPFSFSFTAGCCYSKSLHAFLSVYLVIIMIVPSASTGCCSDPQQWTLPHRTLPPPRTETRSCSPRTEGRPQTSQCEMSATSTDVVSQLKLPIMGRI